jgi:predicted RNA-binding protein YlxR (DUF448 family)
MKPVSHFKEIFTASRTLAERTEKDPLKYFRPTRPQREFLADPAKNGIKLLLGGNQIGKTRAAAVLLLYHVMGRHIYLKNIGITKEAWLITVSHEQSRTIQCKLYEMIPKDELHEDCEFIPGKGFRGLAPVIRFKNPKYGIIRIKTCNQGLALASGSCGLVVIDEPVPAETFNELLARTLRGGKGGTRGTLAITMTPVGIDVQYLRKLVEEGKVSCTIGKLTVEDTTPEGLNPLLTEQQIKSITDSYLPIDREARINGSWDVGILQGRVFENFIPEMISSTPIPKTAMNDIVFSVGIDHGSSPNSQTAVLSAIDMQDTHNPKIYILNEYVGSQAPPEHHARAILEMIKDTGLKPQQCLWTGDTAHQNHRADKRMSNILLMRAYEHILKYPPKTLPWKIRTVRKGKGSFYLTTSIIHAAMSRRSFWIQPNCEKLIQAIQRWQMKRTQSERSRDVYGHVIDAMRYSTASIILGYQPQIQTPKIKIW